MSIIKVFDQMDDDIVKSFNEAESKIKNEEIFRILIKSHGGNYGSFIKISPIIYNIAHKRKHIVGEALHAESAAMLLFLNCSERIVSNENKSLGVIHLPEPNTLVSEEMCKKRTDEAIAFIKRRTHLSESTIKSLNKIPLTSSEMYNLHIATKKVDRFDWAESIY